MRKTTFDILWNNIIYSNAVELATKYKNNLSFDSSKKDDIYSHYEGYREQYKRDWFGGKDKIDKHKVASFIVCAIISELPLKIKTNTITKIPLEIKISNEICAISSGIDLLKSFIIEEFRKNRRPDSYIQEFEKKGICFPETTTNGNYLTQLSRDIYLCRCQGRDAVENRLIPMLFHVFFFLEEYHKKIYHLVSENDENDSQNK